MSLARILVTSKVTMSHTFIADETPIDAAGPVTATVLRLDGTSVSTGAATHGAAGSGTYSWDVTRAVLDSLTLDWSGSVGGSPVTVRDYIEITGGMPFGLDEFRAEFNIPATVTTAQLAARRIQVEQECERICEQAFVPRFAREVLSGNDRQRIGVRWPYIRTVRAVTVDGTVWSAGQIAELGFNDSGTLTRPVGAIWPSGQRNIVVEYEHGWDTPPLEVVDGQKLRLRSLLPRARSGVPDRTTSFTDPNGAVYRLSQPGRRSTGIPDVDGAYAKWPPPKRVVFA